jgi:AcrR family transcriptional regulator
MAIYNHFPDREALLDGIAERAFEGLSLPTQNDGWRRRIRAVIRSVHKLAVDHPKVYAMIMSRPNKPRASFALMTEAMAALRQAGLSEPESVQWYHTFLMLIQGYPVWRAAITQYCSPAEAQLAGLTSAQMEVWKAVHSVSADDQFERAVETLLDVLESKTISLEKKAEG